MGLDIYVREGGWRQRIEGIEGIEGIEKDPRGGGLPDISFYLLLLVVFNKGYCLFIGHKCLRQFRGYLLRLT